MTFKQFLDLVPRLGWEETKMGLRRNWRNDGVYECPITAAYHEKFPEKEVLSTGNYDKAAKALGIIKPTADKWAKAADNDSDTPATIRRGMRRALLGGNS